MGPLELSDIVEEAEEGLTDEEDVDDCVTPDYKGVGENTVIVVDAKVPSLSIMDYGKLTVSQLQGELRSCANLLFLR